MGDRTGRCQIAIREMLRTVCILGVLSGLAGTLSAQAPSAGASTPDSQSARIYGPGDHDVVTPKVIYAPNPEFEFSDKARRKQLSGTCAFSVLVDEQGNVHDVQLIKSAAEGVSSKQRSAAQRLDQKVREAMWQYRFEPATFHRKPVCRVKIEVAYRVY